ncbi:MAG: bifunctional demethylmenaquinone methyltransferase/2-methoxy-6-polyprenyl-1,4-benzoquinol methylase UbiE [bacterium]|nr:bifunctional demethylmenaquinone methyltransferase/2-methoxy-6-polyprenyl-1,4-benzoquinol methylase UbiE [bacterium]
MVDRDVLMKPEAKRIFVRRMFDGIAGTYDLLNHVLSLGIDILWRKQTIDKLEPDPHWRILDLATGTGDLGFESAKRGLLNNVVGVDLSVPMLRQGVGKNPARVGALTFLCGDGEFLPFSDAVFDGLTIGFGIRNVANLEPALLEMFRVIKSGGRTAILEFSRPRSPLFRGIYNIYFKWILPRIGRLISRDASAYHYLYESVMRFPEGPEFCRHLERAGFSRVEEFRLTFGIATIYTAHKG